MKQIQTYPCVLLLIAVAALSTQASRAQVPVTVHPNQQVLLQSQDPQLAANKKLVFDFWRELVQARNVELAPEFLPEDYIQHDPNIGTGRKALVDLFALFQRQPVKPEIDNLVTIVAEGDKVVLARRNELPDPKNPGQTYTTTKFDMFRIKDGKIAEHWDIVTKTAN